MPNMREIRTRINSIQDIMKITNAMYLISSSKLKKAKKALSDTEPYFTRLQDTIHHIMVHTPEMQHIYLGNLSDDEYSCDKPVKKSGYIVITADKGLAGSYNHNILKLAEKTLKSGEENYLFVVGQVGRSYFTRRKMDIDCEFLYTAQNPSLVKARGIGDTMLDLYLKHELDEVYVIYTKMISQIHAEPRIIQLLPLHKKMVGYSDVGTHHEHQSALFTPSPEKVMDYIVPNYIYGLIFGTLVESYSSEQSERMNAMQNATTSARDMIHDLSLIYNRARQAAITQEITEVVSGAKTQKK
ncbi:MAG: ATP synthase F1 subunit gamma [Oscillospiraceae bacterium]|nr:ATP synthase F1 subunit gamma [Oscillospiraceae bacterium]